jgi:aerobic carbon-monoxide dehydrogenase medium subunit
MKACAFDYARPRDLQEALKLLSQDENAKAAAGTQSLGPMLNLRVVQPSVLVDLRFIEELSGYSENEDSVTLGACITHARIEDGKVPDPTRGFMREIASNIAYRAVRNRGTVGGSLVHADPAADWPSALTLLGAVAIIAGPHGRREAPVERFVTGLFQTDLTAKEILVAIRIPKRSPAARFGYWKFCRKAGEFPQAIGAALHDPERKQGRAVIGATGSSPFLFSQAESLLKNPDDKACLAAVDAARFTEDAYNRQLHAVALRRAIERLAA